MEECKKETIYGIAVIKFKVEITNPLSRHEEFDRCVHDGKLDLKVVFPDYDYPDETMEPPTFETRYIEHKVEYFIQ
jgi:hypothetical protein